MLPPRSSTTYHQKIHSGSFGFYSNGIMEGVRLLPLSVSARAVRWSDDDHRCYMTPNGVTNPHGGTVVGRGRRALQATTSAPPLCPPFPVSEEKREERRRKEASIARWSLHMYGMISPLMPPITHINISVSEGFRGTWLPGKEGGDRGPCALRLKPRGLRGGIAGVSK